MVQNGLDKKTGRRNPACFFKCRFLGFALYVAISAVYRFVAARLKRYFCLLAALSAGSRIHLARAATTHSATAISETLGPSTLPALWTTLGLIGIALG